MHEVSGSGGGTTGPAYDPLLFGDFGKRKESRIAPSMVYNTVDNPYTPRAGMRHTATFMFAGGPLGGTVNYYRPSWESIYYHPIGRKMALGMRGQVALINQYGDTQVLPLYQRYFLGGATSRRASGERRRSAIVPALRGSAMMVTAAVTPRSLQLSRAKRVVERC